MCGIFAYINYLSPKCRREVLDILIQGLQRLEYRGYDSAGLAFDGPDKNILICKQKGKVKILKDEVDQLENINENEKLPTHVGIAHTRWATHGPPLAINSHPQRSDENNEFVVIHNGIITNYKDIRQLLTIKGFKFESETDTECIAKLAKHIYDNQPDLTFAELVERVSLQLEGAYALVFKSTKYPGECVATRRGSPLLLGIKTKSSLAYNYISVFSSESNNKEKTSLAHGDHPSTEIRSLSNDGGIEYFYASDASAFIEHTKQTIYLQDDDVACISNGRLSIHRVGRDLADRSPSTREITTLKMEIQQIMKGSFDSFMLKEIFEQPESVFNTMRGRINFETKKVTLGGIQEHLSEIKRCRRFLFFAAGTSYHSAIAVEEIFYQLKAAREVSVRLASSFAEMSLPIYRDDVCVFISQSGETADTLIALRRCKEQGALTIGVTNVVGSSICRETDCGIHLNAGPEIGVASTKAYTSQIVALIMFSLVLSEDHLPAAPLRNKIIDGLKVLPDQIRNILETNSQVLEIAQELYEKKGIYILGRGFNFATCLEGALKIEELTYILPRALLANELKHGPIAAIDEYLALIMILTRDQYFTRSLNALAQVKARGGRPIVIAEEGDQEVDSLAYKTILIPHAVDCLQPVLAVIPFQLLSYHIAVLLGHDVDCPRNLAKSVTVE